MTHPWVNGKQAAVRAHALRKAALRRPELTRQGGGEYLWSPSKSPYGPSVKRNTPETERAIAEFLAKKGRGS